MKRSLPLLLLLLLLNPFMANAAQLTIPKSFEFLAIDGKDLDPGVLAWNKSKSVDLTPGLHRIAIKFYEVVPDRDNPRVQEFLESEPMLIALTVDRGRSYELVPHPDMSKDLYAYAEDPRLKIVDENGQKARYELSLLGQKEKQSLWSKMTGGEQQQVVAQPATGVAGATLPPAASAPVNSAAPAAAMLQYWWSQADAQTRQEFMKWVYTQ